MASAERTRLLRDASAGAGTKVLIAALLAAATATSTVGLAASAAWLIARSAERPGVMTLTFVMGIVQLFALTKAGARYGERLATHDVALSMMARIRSLVARQLLPLLPGGLGRNESQTVDVIIGDVADVEDLLVAVIPPIAAAIVASVVAVAIVGWINPVAAAVLCCGVGVVGLVLPGLAARLGEEPEARLVDVRSKMAELFSTTTASADEIALAGGGDHRDQILQAFENQLESATSSRAVRQGLLGGLSILSAGMTIAAALFIAVHALRDGAINRSVIAVVPLTAMAAIEVVAGVAPAVLSLRRDRASLDRLCALKVVAPVVCEPTCVGPDVARATSMAAKGLDVGYRDMPVVSGLTFELAAGSTTVLGGPSGSGKSTIALTLAKLLDARAGSVALDGTELAVLGGSQVRARVGVMTGEPHLFASTIRANLKLAAPQASDHELLDACRAVGLDTLIDGLEHGLDTCVGGSAGGISGGERRRLGLARELLAKRPIVILDEPTASLDTQSASKALDGFLDADCERAALLISHDPVVLARPGVHGTVADGSVVFACGD